MKSAKKTIFVTGGTSGMGLAIAKKLIQNNFNVIVASRSRSKLDKAQVELSKFGDTLETLKLDVSNAREVTSAFAHVFKKYGQLDCLVNAAGVSIHGDFADLGERDWDEVIDVNLKGSFLCCKAVWNHMVENKKSHPQIITISSASGLRSYSSGSIYCASKFGVNGLMEALALEGQEIGIKVSTINPGQVDTAIWNPNDPDVNSARQNMLKAEDVANLIYFMLTLGQNVHIRGVSIHPFAIQPYLKGRNRGPGGEFPKKNTHKAIDKAKTFRI